MEPANDLFPEIITNKLAYYPGELCEGVIRMTISTPVSFSLMLNFQCSESNFSQSIDHLAYESGLFEKTDFEKGEVLQPFSFIIPVTLPPQFKYESEILSYFFIDAIIILPTGKRIIATQFISITPNADMYKIPTSKKECTDLKVCGCIKNQVDLSCHMAKSAFAVGEPIKITCCITNMQGKSESIKLLYITFNEIMKIPNKGIIKERHWEKLENIDIGLSTDVCKPMTIEFDTSVVRDSTHFCQTSKSDKFECEYFIEISLLPDSCCFAGYTLFGKPCHSCCCVNTPQISFPIILYVKGKEYTQHILKLMEKKSQMLTPKTVILHNEVPKSQSELAEMQKRYLTARANSIKLIEELADCSVADERPFDTDLSKVNKYFQ